MRRLLIFALCLAWAPVHAGTYCTPMPKPKAEGDTWYIPEEAFTKEEAMKALKGLEALVSQGWEDRDFDAHNLPVRVRGYLYRSYLDEYRKKNGKDDKYVKEAFCEFLRKEAFVSH